MRIRRTYTVLYGARGEKAFRNISNAKKFAIHKAKTHKDVEINKIEHYPYANKPGMTDWSQSFYKKVKYRGKR